MDLEFTLRSADVVEKQDGPTAWIKSVRWIRGYRYNPRVGQGQLGCIPRFFVTRRLGNIGIHCQFFWGFDLMPKNVFFSLEVSLCHRGASGTKSRSEIIN